MKAKSITLFAGLCIVLSSCGTWNGFITAEEPEAIAEGAEQFLKRPKTLRVLKYPDRESFAVLWKGGYDLSFESTASSALTAMDEKATTQAATAEVRKVAGWTIVYVPMGDPFLFWNTVDELNKIPKLKKVKIFEDLSGKYESVLMYK